MDEKLREILLKHEWMGEHFRCQCGWRVENHSEDHMYVQWLAHIESLERAQPATPLPSIASTSITIGPINEGSVERICDDCGGGYTTRDGHTCQPSVAAQGTDEQQEQLAKAETSGTQTS